MFGARLTSRKILIAAALVAIVVGVVLGVTLSGGSSGPTKAQYVAKADAICKTAKAQTTPLIKEIATSVASLVGGSANTQKVATLVGRLHTEAAADLARLRALTQPSGDHAAIQSFLQPLATVVNAMGKAVSALRGGQTLQAVGLLQQMQPTAAQVTSAAQAYGLTQCSQLLSTLG